MIASWKSLAPLLIGLGAIVWFGLRTDNASAELPQQVSATAPGCGTPDRCMVDVRYAYPAADLSVISDGAYF